MAPTTTDWSEIKFCELCQKGLNSAHQAEQHFSSAKHLKRSQSQNKESGVGGRKRKIVNTEYEDDIRQNGPGDGLGFDIDPELDQIKTHTEVTGGGHAKKSKVDYEFCKICNKMLTSPAVVEAHYNSPKHLKRLQINNKPVAVPNTNSDNKTMALQEPESMTPFQEAVADCPGNINQSESQKDNIQQQTTSDWSKVKFCQLCQKGLNSAHQAEQHFSSIKHLKRTQNKTLESQEPESKAPPLPVDPSSSQEAVADCPGNVNASCYPSESQKVNIQQQTPTSDWSKVKFCQLCQKGLNSAHQAEQHFSSIKHLKRTQNKTLAPQEPESMALQETDSKTPPLSVDQPSFQEPESKTPPLSVDQSLFQEAESMAPPLSVDQSLFQEAESMAPPLTVDQSTFQEAESKAPPLPVDQSTSQEERADCHGNINQSLAPPTPGTYREFREQKSVLNNQTATSGHFYCSFCNVALNSQTQIDAHRAGARHKKTVTKWKQEQNSLRQQQIAKAGEKMGCKTPFHFV